MEPKLAELLGEVRAARGRVLALTGAGISAESGIPTFRGSEGYWVVGSRNYMPQEMATREMFDRRPDEVWRWYLHRFGLCREAQPNAGHRALVALEAALEYRFDLGLDGTPLRHFLLVDKKWPLGSGRLALVFGVGVLWESGAAYTGALAERRGEALQLLLRPNLVF